MKKRELTTNVNFRENCPGYRNGILKITESAISAIYSSIYVVVLVLLLGLGQAFGQAGPLPADLLKITKASDTINHKKQPENIYLQFDKPYYAVDDTIWFKAYLLNEAYLAGSDKSGFMYLDIANDSNKVIKKYKFPLKGGLGWGDITLDKNYFAPGTYTIRAYTNWMRNFGDECFFYKRFYVTGLGENNLLVNKQEALLAANNGTSADVKLRFSEMDKKPYLAKQLELQLTAGRTNISKQKIQTDHNGMIAVNFAVPQKASGIKIIARDENGKTAVIPLILNRPEKTDIQFLPEGGSLVAGFRSVVGFKAISEDGKCTDVSGIITDSEQHTVAEFKSLHNGMGSFELMASSGEEYTAKATLPGGVIKSYPLPVVKTSGTVMQIKNQMESDSIEVFIAPTKDIVLAGNSYFLIGKARGIVCYAGIVDFSKGIRMKKKVAKNLFPTGITHFVLMTVKRQPLNERLVFIDHRNNLDVQLNTDKPVYGLKDSVGVQIKVTDNSGKPVAGNFSLAVTDDAQLKNDTLNNENIISHFLLSGLKGYVEAPGYYLPANNKEKWLALDNLLLTQGWINYDWQQVLTPPAITYAAESEFNVKGKVVNIFSKPVKGTNILLFSKSPVIIMDTVTDKEGRFIFHHFPVVDSPLFILKAVNRHGRDFNIKINVDEIPPPPFTAQIGPLTMPWYVNSDNALINYTKISAQPQTDSLKGKHMLKEVKITAKKIVKDSQNINGPGNADQVIDEKELENAGKKTWLQLLQEKIPGFRESIRNVAVHNWASVGDGAVTDIVRDTVDIWYYVKYKRVAIVIDGIVLDSTFSSVPTFADETRFLQSHNAEDIKGIEINLTSKYSSGYVQRFIPQETYSPINVDYVFIEITTRSGSGPFIHNIPGLYLYKPLKISSPSQFYKPRYTIADTSSTADIRSTIDWEPAIKTDANGEAKLWFYTADKPSTYSFIIEGTDTAGNLGLKKGKITIAKAAVNN